MSWTLWPIIGFPFACLLGMILWDVRSRADSAEPSPGAALVKWTKVLSLFTLALVGVTAYSAYVLRVTDHTLRETLEAGNRAWISPSRAGLLSPVESDGGPIVVVYYQNVGRDPALEVRVGMAVFTPPVSKPAENMREVPDVPWALVMPQFEETCKAIAPLPTGAAVVFPSTIVEKHVYSPLTGPWEKARILAGQDIVVVSTCFTYRTIEKIRHTGFCEYLAPKPGQPTSSWDFLTCPAGNLAD